MVRSDGASKRAIIGIYVVFVNRCFARACGTGSRGFQGGRDCRYSALRFIHDYREALIYSYTVAPEPLRATGKKRGERFAHCTQRKRNTVQARATARPGGPRR